MSGIFWAPKLPSPPHIIYYYNIFYFPGLGITIGLQNIVTMRVLKMFKVGRPATVRIGIFLAFVATFFLAFATTNSVLIVGKLLSHSSSFLNFSVLAEPEPHLILNSALRWGLWCQTAFSLLLPLTPYFPVTGVALTTFICVSNPALQSMILSLVEPKQVLFILDTFGKRPT